MGGRLLDHRLGSFLMSSRDEFFRTLSNISSPFPMRLLGYSLTRNDASSRMESLLLDWCRSYIIRSMFGSSLKPNHERT